jgi:hypothetical protein
MHLSHLPHPTRPPAGRHVGLSLGLERPLLRLPRFAATLLLTVVSALAVPGVLAPPASAAPTVGASNWAGYVSTGRGTRFTDVSGTWVTPAVLCTIGRATYMSNWIGLGGDRSNTVEQIGTESDCGANGIPTYSSWFELYPKVSGDPQLTIRPGDVVSARVTISRGDVRLDMTNRTLGTRFTQRLHADQVDVSSAEWIVEAPSVCLSADIASCGDSVLSDFGSTRFTTARASAAGRTGTVTGPGWSATPYTLATGGPSTGGVRVIAAPHAGSRAVLGRLSGSHDAFGVTFAAGG